MTGETEREESAWTTDTLKSLMDRSLDDLNRLLDERHEAQKEAVRTALDAMEKRLDSVNEFRGQLADQALTFQRQDVANTRHEAQEARMRTFETFMAEQAGKSIGAAALVGWVLAGIAVVGFLLMLYAR